MQSFLPIKLSGYKNSSKTDTYVKKKTLKRVIINLKEG